MCILYIYDYDYIYIYIIYIIGREREERETERERKSMQSAPSKPPKDDWVSSAGVVSSQDLCLRQVCPNFLDLSGELATSPPG